MGWGGVRMGMVGMVPVRKNALRHLLPEFAFTPTPSSAMEPIAHPTTLQALGPGLRVMGLARLGPARCPAQARTLPYFLVVPVIWLASDDWF